MGAKFSALKYFLFVLCQSSCVYDESLLWYFLFLQQDVEKFTDIEKLYLYLKLPSGPSSGNDKRYVTDTLFTRVFHFGLLFFFMSHTHMAALLWLSLHYWHCCLIACQKIQVAIRRLLRAQTQFRLLDCKKKKKCKRFLLCDIFGGSLVTGEFFFSSYEIIIHFSAVWLIIIMKQTTDKCRLLLYLAVCVSFVSPYLFITPTPQFCPFGLRMRGGPPLLDYGIKVSVLTRNDAYKSKTLPHQVYFSHVLISVIRVPCHLAVLNRCMHSTGYGIT